MFIYTFQARGSVVFLLCLIFTVFVHLNIAALNQGIYGEKKTICKNNAFISLKNVYDILFLSSINLQVITGSPADGTRWITIERSDNWVNESRDLPLVGMSKIYVPY